MLTITNLDLSYPGDEPLATVFWQVNRGDQVALLGRSGTGKSTLLAAIVQGSPAIIKDSERIAYLSQQPALLPWATAIENVLLGFKLRGDTQSPEATEQALDLLGRGRARHLCSSSSLVAQRRPKSSRRSCTRITRTIRFSITG